MRKREATPRFGVIEVLFVGTLGLFWLEERSVLTPVERRGPAYVFDTAGQAVISPREQRFRAILKATSAQLQSSPSLPASRTLFWRIANLSARASYSSPSPDNTNRP